MRGCEVAVLLPFLNEVDLWGGWEIADEAAPPKTSSGGMFSPKVRTNFAIFFLLSISVKSPFLLTLPVLEVMLDFRGIDADGGKGLDRGEMTGADTGLDRMRYRMG